MAYGERAFQSRLHFWQRFRVTKVEELAAYTNRFTLHPEAAINNIQKPAIQSSL
jgi:hypothetical protein